MTASTAKRKIVNVRDPAAFRPFDRYGKAIPGFSWIPISFDLARGEGSYLLRIEAGARSLPHEHTGFEEFLVLDGTLQDHDGTHYRAGDFVTFLPGSRHWSVSPGGCTLAVFMRGPNRPLDAAEVAALEGKG